MRKTASQLLLRLVYKTRNELRGQTNRSTKAHYFTHREKREMKTQLSGQTNPSPKQIISHKEKQKREMKTEIITPF